MKHFDEHAHIRYAKLLSLYQVEKPYTILSQGVVKHNNLCNTNLETESTTLQRVEDVRKYHQGQFALDSHGFQFTRHEFNVDNWYDGNDVEGQYLPAVERVLRQMIPDVAEIRIFDWRVRIHLNNSVFTLWSTNHFAASEKPVVRRLANPILRFERQDELSLAGYDGTHWYGNNHKSRAHD